MKYFHQNVLVFVFIITSYHSVEAQFHFEFLNIGRDTSISQEPVTVLPGDFNNDGTLDVLVNYDYRYFMLYEYDSIGYHNPIRINSPEYDFEIRSIKLADIDNNGFLDIICKKEDHLAVIRNQNGRSLSQEINVTGSGDFDLEDLNNDGFLDIVSAKGINLCKGQSIEYDTLLPVWDSALSIRDTEIFSFVDFDGDSINELALGNSERISFLSFEIINGEVTRKTEDRWEIIDDYVTIAEYQFVDVDNDAIPELFVLTRKSDISPLSFSVLGYSRFPVEKDIYRRTDVSTFAIGDLNNDGNLDIFMKGNRDNFLYSPTNEAFVGFTKDDLFSEEHELDHISFLTNPQFFDLNGDSINDIILQDAHSHKQSDIAIYYNFNNVVSEFTTDRLEFLPLHYNNFNIVDTELTDVNGDKLKDLVINSVYGGLFVYLHTGSYPYYDTLTYIQNINEDIRYGSPELQLLDFNRDGAEDLIFEFENKIYLMLNDSATIFTEPQVIYESNEESIRSYATFDLDSDGFEDILIDRTKFGTEWLRNSNGILLEPIVVFDPDGLSFENIIKYDVDNDGLLDFVAGKKDVLQIYLKEVSGSFKSYTFRTNTATTAFTVGDYDSDGLIDIIKNDLDNFSNTQHLKSFEFDHTIGELSAETLLQDVSNTGDIDKIILHDFDNDGFKDIFYSGNKNSSFVHHLDGNGLFSSPLGFPESNLPDRSFAFVLDINGDNAADLITYRGNLSDNLQLAINEINARNKISGVIGLSENGVCDNESEVLSNLRIVTESSSDELFSFSYNNGFYEVYPETGQHTVHVDLSAYPGLFAEPAFHEVVFDSVRQQSVNDFCLTADSTYMDFELVSFLSHSARLGERTDLVLNVKNNGPLTRSAAIEIDYNSELFRLLTNIPSNNGRLRLDIPELKAYQTETYRIKFRLRIPPEANIQDTFSFISKISPTVNDQTPDNNESRFEGEIVGPYDPNDIIVLQGESILFEQKDDYLNYIIRFQNVGNSYARNVRVENLLDPKLDWRSLELLDLSHIATSAFKSSSNILTFEFNNIFLPDSITNFDASNGFISYKIKPKADVSLGDIIENTAQIYFDFNDPIMTNIARTEIVDELDTTDDSSPEINVFPSPTEDMLFIESSEQINQIEFYDLKGQKMKTMEDIFEIDLSDLIPGAYLLKVNFVNGSALSKIILRS